MFWLYSDLFCSRQYELKSLPAIEMMTTEPEFLHKAVKCWGMCPDRIFYYPAQVNLHLEFSRITFPSHCFSWHQKCRSSHIQYSPTKCFSG